MGWILGSLADSILDIILGLLGFISGLFGKFQLSIGWGNGTENLFDIVLMTRGSGSPASSLSFYFLLIAIVFIWCGLLFKYLYGILGPLDETEEPLTMTLNACLATILVAFSYNIFIMFEKFVNNKFYKPFRDLSTSVTNTAKGALENKQTEDVIDKATTFSWSSMKNKLIDEGSVLGLGESESWLVQLVITFVLIFLFGALVYQLISFIAEFYMRYIVLGVMFYTCPLAFACFAFKSTRNIFWSWLRMVMAQFLLLILGLFFMAIFNNALYNLAANSVGSEFMFKDSQDLLTTMFLLIGWLVVGQKMDNYLGSLGLSVAHTGSGLMAATIGGLATIRTLTSTAKTAVKAGKWGAEAAGKIKDKVGDVIDTKTGRKDADALQAQMSKDLHTIATAPKVNGMHTREGAEAIMGTETQSLEGLSAHQAAEAIGITPENCSINPADVDPSKTKIGEGRVAFSDSDGNLLGEVAKSGSHETPSGEAMKQIPIGSGQNMKYGDVAVTKGMNDADMKSIMKDVQNNPAYEGMQFTQPDDATIVGYNPKTGERYQFTPAYRGEADSELGSASYAKTSNGLPYIAQDITGAYKSAQDSVSTQTSEAMEYLSSAQSGITWQTTDTAGNPLPAGTFMGVNDKGVPVSQGSLEGYASFDESKGSVSSITTPGGTPISVQPLDKPGTIEYATPGFASTHNPAVESVGFKNVKPVASSPELVKKAPGSSESGKFQVENSTVTHQNTMHKAPNDWSKFSSPSSGFGQDQGRFTRRPSGRPSASPSPSPKMNPNHAKIYKSETDDRISTRFKGMFSKRKDID